MEGQLISLAANPSCGVRFIAPKIRICSHFHRYKIAVLLRPCHYAAFRVEANSRSVDFVDKSQRGGILAQSLPCNPMLNARFVLNLKKRVPAFVSNDRAIPTCRSITGQPLIWRHELADESRWNLKFEDFGVVRQICRQIIPYSHQISHRLL